MSLRIRTPNTASVTSSTPTPTEPTQAELELSAVNTAILAILNGKSSSYSLAGRSVSALDLNTLYGIQAKLKARVARENGVSTKSLIRFS